MSKKKTKKQTPPQPLDVDDVDGALDQKIVTEVDESGQAAGEESDKGLSSQQQPKSKGKKNKKKRKDDDDWEDDILNELELMKESEGKQTEVVHEPPIQTSVDPPPEADDDFNSSSKPEKVEVKTRPVKTTDVESGDDEDEESSEGLKMKTKAQKKAEKKERERQQKRQQKKVQRDDPDSKGAEVTKNTVPSTKKETEDSLQTHSDDDSKTASTAKDKKKADKSKDKKEKTKPEKAVGKGPSKSQIKAMQDALHKLREEEEQMKREEEEKQRLAEEAETKRLEDLAAEQERKERRKQKEKERKSRQKAEGRYLTKSQKEAKARGEAMLAIMKEQGIEIPTRESVENKKKRPIYEKRKKNVVRQDSSNTEETDTTPTEPSTGIQKTDSKSSFDEEGDDNVKDTWDAESEDEQEEEESSDSSSSDNSSSSSEDDDDDDDGRSKMEIMKQKVKDRIAKRRAERERNRSSDELRAPVCCVLGHVDTGKTKILDKLRRTNVQDGEAGGITQQIGATNVPIDVIVTATKMVDRDDDFEFRLPGILIIDTPGHEAFSNLRVRGSSLCDVAILVVDIMHGLEPQTIESLNLLRKRQTPFVVALNKIDRLYEWTTSPDTDVATCVKNQQRITKDEFFKKTNHIITEFAEQGLNAALFYENPDPSEYISLIPTSAHSGDGMGNLLLKTVEVAQTQLAQRLSFSQELQCTVLEVKAIPGLGTTIDIILVNGTLREADTVILAGIEGPILTQVRALLMPQPLRELRVKNQYEQHKEVKAAQGVKILAKDLEKAMAGLPLLVAERDDEVDVLKDEVDEILKQQLGSIKLSEHGVYVSASTLGSLEALLHFLKTSKIPYAGITIGPIHKRDVVKASVMLEKDDQYAVILAFDVKVEREAQEIATAVGIQIFQADIIYHLFDEFMKHRDELKLRKREELKDVVIYPCKMRILPQYVFNSRDPIIIGVTIEAGLIKAGTPICIPSKEQMEIGTVSTIELNHKNVPIARKGQEVCIKIDPSPSEAPKMYGRHFDHTDLLVSKITRASIDALKEWFRDDLQKSDWMLIVELKKLLNVL